MASALDGEEERSEALAKFMAGGKVFPEPEGTDNSMGQSLGGHCVDTEVSGE